MLCVAIAFTCFGIIIGISIMELVIIHEENKKKRFYNINKLNKIIKKNNGIFHIILEEKDAKDN